MATTLACTGGNITLNEIILAVNDNIERGGIYWAAGITYKKGDLIAETDTFNEIWICNIDHTSAAGNNANGAPSEVLATNWDWTIPDPSTF